MIRIHHDTPRKYVRSHLVWFLLWVCVTGIAIYLSPNPHGHGTHQQLGLPPCPSVLVFGRPCPGCGLTTSFTAMVHGQFVHAFESNPFGPILYLAFTVSAGFCLYGYIRRIKFDMGTKSGNWALICLVSAYVAFGTIRFAVTDPVEYASNYWHRGSVRTDVATPASTR